MPRSDPGRPTHAPAMVIRPLSACSNPANRSKSLTCRGRSDQAGREIRGPGCVMRILPARSWNARFADRLTVSWLCCSSVNRQTPLRGRNPPNLRSRLADTTGIRFGSRNRRAPEVDTYPDLKDTMGRRRPVRPNRAADRRGQAPKPRSGTSQTSGLRSVIGTTQIEEDPPKVR
jgi:hypothetical protein